MRAWLALCALGVLGGCGGEDGEGDAARVDIALQDANNYRSSGALTIPRVETASATDLEICWDDLLSDFRCHDVAPQDDVDTVALLRLRLSKEEAELRLGSSELAQSEVDGYLDFKTDHRSMCTRLSDMSFFGTPIEIAEEYVESAQHTYVLLYAKGTTPGVGARSMTFVTPTSGSSNTRVDAESGCGLLEFEADIGVATPVAISNEGPWRVGWHDITRDSQGNEIVFENIDGVLLGFFEGMTTAELQEQVFDLELLATELWEVELDSNRSADLSTARRRDSTQFFTGFDRSAPGVWLLALTCATCQNPAPLMLTVLQPGNGAS